MNEHGEKSRRTQEARPDGFFKADCGFSGPLKARSFFFTCSLQPFQPSHSAMSARTTLLSVLAEAASQEQHRMKNAVDQLQQWETTPQFNATLQVRKAQTM